MKAFKDIHQDILNRLLAVKVEATVYDDTTPEYFARLLQEDNWESILKKVSYDVATNTATIVCFTSDKTEETILETIPEDFDCTQQLEWDIGWQSLVENYVRIAECRAREGGYESIEDLHWIHSIYPCENSRRFDAYGRMQLGDYLIFDTYDNQSETRDNIFALCTVSRTFAVRYTEVKYCAETSSFVIAINKTSTIVNAESRDLITRTFKGEEAPIGGKRASGFDGEEIYIRGIGRGRLTV